MIGECRRGIETVLDSFLARYVGSAYNVSNKLLIAPKEIMGFISSGVFVILSSFIVLLKQL